MQQVWYKTCQVMYTQIFSFFLKTLVQVFLCFGAYFVFGFLIEALFANSLLAFFIIAEHGTKKNLLLVTSHKEN